MSMLTVLCFSLFCLATSVKCFEFTSMSRHIRQQLSIKNRFASSRSVNTFSASPLPFSLVPQGGDKVGDAIQSLPGQPQGVDFSQYSGYVTVDPSAGRALFYYFAESPQNSSTNPLVLWLNGGPGCSSLGAGAMMELGPFRVNKDGQTLSRNEYAWNNNANILFLESPAGVGFSYSNTTADYNISGDTRTADDSYIFLLNWLERFPEYKTRDFYITGESYAGHYVPQLAQTILHQNKITNQTVINLKGIAIGNALIDDETAATGSYDFLWSHATISDELYKGVQTYCNFSGPHLSDACIKILNEIDVGYLYPYNIYAPWCGSSAASIPLSAFDPCTENYIAAYLNIPQVQASLHANLTSLPYPWTDCSSVIENWSDSPDTMLPVIQELMESRMRVWIYSGDVDGVLPVTTSRYAIDKIGLPINTAWYPWYSKGEVGGYAVAYQNLTFVTIRGSGHFVPSYQPDRALTFFTSFVNGVLPSSTPPPSCNPTDGCHN